MARSLAPSRWSYLQYGDDQAARFCHSVYRTVRILFERLHRILAQEAGEAGAAALRTSPFLFDESRHAPRVPQIPEQETDDRFSSTVPRHVVKAGQAEERAFQRASAEDLGLP